LTREQFEELVFRSENVRYNIYTQREDYKGNQLFDRVDPGGLYFCLTLYNRGFPTISPYGDLRCEIPLDELPVCDLYFLNSYLCRDNRYVVLGVSIRGEVTRVSNIGVLLDWETNPFFRRVGADYFVSDVCCLWIELFITFPLTSNKRWTYTDNIRITGRNTYA